MIPPYNAVDQANQVTYMQKCLSAEVTDRIVSSVDSYWYPYCFDFLLHFQLKPFAQYRFISKFVFTP